MQSVEIHGLRQVQEAFERLPEAVRRAKAEVFEAVGEYLLEDVQNRIGGSGRVAGAQEYRVGSGKGYVAVRAKKETWLDGAAAGYVTNALENGHVQTPGRYVPALGARLRRDRVSGKYMYQITGRREGPRMAEEAARRIESVKSPGGPSRYSSDRPASANGRSTSISGRTIFSLQGTLRYGPFTVLQSDIMGPFRFFAGMQCSHGVISMGHSLAGALELNGEYLDFSDGTGYIEADRGRSFPSAYLWTQCVWSGSERVSLMLAVATIPLPVGSFTGCICSVLTGGREYRLATYRGARIAAWSASGAVIRQGKYRLEAQLLNERQQPLRAPVEGRMERTIHESLCAEVRYRFQYGDDLLFEHTDPNAGFEYSSAD